MAWVAHKSLKRDMASELLPVTAYDNDTGLYFLDTSELGFAFIAEPLWAADDQTISRLNVLLNQDWPKDAVLQFTLWAGSDIAEHLSVMQDLRVPEFRLAGEQRAAFFKEGAKNTAIDSLKVRNMHLIISAKAPIEGHGTHIPDRFIDKMTTLKAAFSEGMKAVGFSHQEMKPSEYIRLMQSIFCQGEDPQWMNSPYTDYSDKEPISEQVFDYDTTVDIKPDGIEVGQKKIKVLSVKKFPSAVFFGDAMRYLAEPIAGGRGIPENCMITTSIIFPDAESLRASLDKGKSYVTHQAYGPMVRHIPRLASRKQAFDAMFEAMDDGDRPMKVYLGMAIFADKGTKKLGNSKENGAVSNAKVFWREAGFHLVEDKYITLPAFLNMLPMGVDIASYKDMFRFKTMATRHVAPMLPIFSDWKGTATPVMNFLSRKGQMMRYSLFDTGSNYNCVIAAQSGSGKSFLTNEMITSYLECGGRAWAIDVGRSYEKLCTQLGGQFLVFGAESNICINPFNLVKDYDEESDLLVGIVAAMAAPTQPLSDLQMSHLRRIIADIWKEHGQNTQVDYIAEACLAEEDSRVNDVGHQLYAFTSKGEYGRYFNGKNNVRFDSNFVVVELEELKAKAHLQQVVLLQMVYQIQQEMYLGERDRHKLVLIDEAWDLLTRGDIAKFIETGFRRFRKYGGAAVVITQSVNDLYEASSGRAIAENSSNMLLLGQKKDAIDNIQKEGRLSISDFGYQMLKTVHTVPGKYSEIFMITESGQGVARLIVDEHRRLLYSTKAEDMHAIDSFRNMGLSVDEAIDRVLRDRGIVH